MGRLETNRVGFKSSLRPNSLTSCRTPGELCHCGGLPLMACAQGGSGTLAVSALGGLGQAWRQRGPECRAGSPACGRGGGRRSLFQAVPPAISTKPGAILLLEAAAPAATSRQRRLLETQLEDSGGWEAGVMSRVHRAAGKLSRRRQRRRRRAGRDQPFEALPPAPALAGEQHSGTHRFSLLSRGTGVASLPLDALTGSKERGN